MTINIKTAFKDEEVEVIKTKYGNGRVAITLLNAQTSEPEFVATANIEEEVPADGCVFLKGWRENAGLPEALEKAGVVKLTGRVVPFGAVTAVEGKLMEGRPDVMKEGHLEFLTGLKKSGETNMFGATTYLEEKYGMTHEDAHKVLLYWMSTYEEAKP